MADYEKKELKTLGKIAKELEKLDTTLEELEKSEEKGQKVKHFFKQEKAIHEIRKIINLSEHFDHLIDESARHDMRVIEADEDLELVTIHHILKHLDNLDDSLEKIVEEDNKVKAYIEQRKALHEVKRILHETDLYDGFIEDELRHL